MDVSGIPKIFWYSVSISIVFATFGLTIIAYHSANVSIEIANTKINLSSAITETEQIARELRQENERLKIINENLQEKMRELTGQSSSPKTFQGLEKFQLDDQKLFLIPDKRFEAIDRNLQALKEQVRG